MQLQRYPGGMRECIRAIVASDGIAGLYYGFRPFLIQASGKAAVRFSIYASITQAVDATGVDRSHAPAKWSMACGLGAVSVARPRGPGPSAHLSAAERAPVSRIPAECHPEPRPPSRTPAAIPNPGCHPECLRPPLLPQLIAPSRARSRAVRRAWARRCCGRRRPSGSRSCASRRRARAPPRAPARPARRPSRPSCESRASAGCTLARARRRRGRRRRRPCASPRGSNLPRPSTAFH